MQGGSYRCISLPHTPPGRWRGTELPPERARKRRFRFVSNLFGNPDQRIAGVPQFVRGDVFYWGQLMAAALLGSIPVAIIYSFFVEHYVAGLTAGSVKG